MSGVPCTMSDVPHMKSESLARSHRSFLFPPKHRAAGNRNTSSGSRCFGRSVLQYFSKRRAKAPREAAAPFSFHRNTETPKHLFLRVPLRPPRLCGSLFHPKNQDNRRDAKAAEGSQSRNDEIFLIRKTEKQEKTLCFLHSRLPHSRNPKPKSSSISNPIFLRAAVNSSLPRHFRMRNPGKIRE